MGAARCAWRTSQLREDGPGGRLTISGSSCPGSISRGGGTSLNAMRDSPLSTKIDRAQAAGPEGCAFGRGQPRAPRAPPKKAHAGRAELRAHAVPATALGLIQLFVGALDQVGGRLVVLQQRAADADRDWDLFTLKREAVAADARA